MEEVWRDIEGWEGQYQVSNYGRVKHLNYRNTGMDVIMKATYINGYPRVHLSDHGKDAKVLVHKVEIAAFIPNPNNYPIVNHKDENPKNNFIWVNPDGSVNPDKSNLEWCTYLYNARYGTAIQRKVDKLSKKVLQYSIDGKYITEYKSTKEVERQLGLFATSIAACCRGRHHTCGGYKWRYAS